VSAATEAVIVPVPAMPGVPGQCLHRDAGDSMRAEPGDTLAIDGAGMAGLPRLGMIIAVYGRDGAPPYLVRWTAGDYESRVHPGPGARIEKPFTCRPRPPHCLG
jgi:Domain of unknown function (DUF1918)